MPPDCYKVEVLHLLNPHLIWVEVREPAIIDENGIKFEQIGIYGLLPLETTIDLDDEEITVQRCKEWQPASANLMRKFLTDVDEVLFSPTHLDRRSSIFDDNIHKFGDLLIKKKNGNTKSMTKLLSTSGFSTYDVCLFHQHLSEGRINTKLNNTDTQKVLTELENYYKNKKEQKNKWEKSIKKQTSVARVTHEFEEVLTKTNLDKHNKTMKLILESKKKDLELCKGVDEPSVGRATTRKGKDKKKSIPVESKLELLHSYKCKADLKDSDVQENNDNEHLQAFEDTKLLLENIASPYSKKISSKTDAHKAQILKKVMSKTAIKKVSKHEKLANRLIDSKEATNFTEMSHPVTHTEDSISTSSQASVSGHEHDDIIKKAKEVEELNQSTKTDETSFLTSKQDENLLDMYNDIKLHKIIATDTQKTKKSGKSSCNNNQEPSDKVQNNNALILKEDPKNTFDDSNSEKPQQHSLKGKLNKKLKGEANNSILGPKELFGSSIPTMPLHRLAYPLQNTNKDQESQSYQRVPEITNDCEAFLTKPVSEYMVNKLMNTFKLTGSKHSDMIQNAIRKCKDGGKNNSEAIAALLECRSKIIDEIKELDDPKNLANINLDLPLSQTVTKTKLKKKGKKRNVGTVKAKAIFGPPGIDITTLTRVPPVFLYSEETSSNDGQSPEGSSKRPYSLNDENFTLNLTSDKNVTVTCTYENKPVSENMRLQENYTKKQRHDTKDTSSSSSSVWERRLKLHKEMAKNKRSTSQTSDTTNKDSSNVEENVPPTNIVKQKVEDDSDESISEVIEQLALKTNNTLSIINKDDKISEYACSKVAIKANPFQNFDLNNSVFVENLVTPIMMVHSKMNKRFTPTCHFRDIHFSDHIRLVLKNLRVEQPMMIQSITWNAILRGYSVFMIGSASSGKTMGYLPAVCRLVSDFNQSNANSDSVGPFGIIVCATAQSVSDIDRMAKMMVGCEEKVVSCYYGHDELSIATSLLNGCDLLISTAPMLVRLLQMSEFGLDLQRLATFVLDDCERLSEVYSIEIKICLYKIKEMLKSRVNKELSVQYVVASRTWCDFMEPFAKKAPDSVVCIGAFHECVLYSKANMTVRYVKKEKKLNHLIEFLEDIDPSKKTVVVCDTDEEVDDLNRAIQADKFFIFASNSKMTVQDLYNLSMLWKEFREPFMAPVLICRDANLYHMNIANAHNLIQYSMPSLFSTFCRRFATLNESYPSIFKTDNHEIKILILLEENNVEQLPKIINFVKRCTKNIPDYLDDICTEVLAKKDAKKAANFTPLCNTLMSLGDCPDFYNCKSRHTVLKDYDKPKEWMPQSGIITFKILHYQSATCYSARLIENYNAGTNVKYPSTYSSLSLKMGIHYSTNKNRILLGVPQLGDICAVALRNNFFARAKVIKIINRYEKGNPKDVLVNLLDEEIMEITSDTNLYHLPNDLKRLDTYVVHIRLANIQPRDKDIVFSELAKDTVKYEDIVSEKSMYMRGKIRLIVGNCIFVDTLEAYQDLKSLNETVVAYNVKRDLLEKHAEVNLDHIHKIERLCEKAELEIKPPQSKVNEALPLLNVPQKVNWAHLEEDMTLVDFGTVINPDIIFVRLIKFEQCMRSLITDIQEYVAENTAGIKQFVKNDIVLAEHPDDGLYERARIEEIGNGSVKCFFVDQGEWRHLSSDKLIPISDTLIARLPFQAIECRLLGLKPSGDQWTDFSTNWLIDRCGEIKDDAMKQLFVKYFTKGPAQFTEGNKYGIVIIDTYSNEDIVVNQEMLQLNLGEEVEDEMEFLKLVKHKNDNLITLNGEKDDDEASWQKKSKSSINADNPPNTPTNILLSQPIRSVPLVTTDDESDDSERWHINITDDMAAMFKPLMDGKRTLVTKTKLPSIECDEVKTLEKTDVDFLPTNTENISSNDCEVQEEIDLVSLPKNIEICSTCDPEIQEEIDVNSLSKNIEECSRQFQHIKIKPDSSQELDSDDLSCPETCQSSTETEKSLEAVQILLGETQLRKPKVIWKQTKTTVILKILLVGVDNYHLKIQDRSLTFTATVNDANYGFNFDLYGVINIKNAIHSNKGQYILVKVNKIMHKNWLTLTKDGGIQKWIAYDVDSIDTSSEGEEVGNDNLYNIIKNIYYKEDSDSDEDLVDDVSYKP